MPFFTVVIPVYNKEMYIEHTLASVFNQTFSDFEIVLIDDGSTDNSKALIAMQSDSRLRTFYQPNQGVSVARNKGIQEATATYIAFLDADDLWEPDHLATLHRFCTQFPNDSIFNTAKMIDTGNQLIPARYSISKTGEYERVNFFEASRIEPVIWTSSVAIKKTLFDQVGVFDPQLKSGQDLDLWIRMSLQANVVFIWHQTVRYVYAADSLSKQSYLTPKKMNFEKYQADELINPALKIYLDWNRYSLGIKSKLRGDWTYYNQMKQEINWKKMPFKKRILFRLPVSLLRVGLKLQPLLLRVGLRNTLFK